MTLFVSIPITLKCQSMFLLPHDALVKKMSFNCLGIQFEFLIVFNKSNVSTQNIT